MQYVIHVVAIGKWGVVLILDKFSDSFYNNNQLIMSSSNNNDHSLFRCGITSNHFKLILNLKPN